ncbi:MAG: prolyl oligopeptidase family serine peptidase [Bacteroidales bacterium]
MDQKNSRNNCQSRPVLFLIAFFCLTGSSCIWAQSSSRFSFNKYANGKGDTLNYRLLFPDYDTVRKYPLVIFLHGSGERGNDNEAQLQWGVMNFATDQAMVMHPAIVIAPQCPANQEWSNFAENEKTGELRLRPDPSKPMELVLELIHQLIKTFSIDTNRIYITGLSMGGYGTYDAIERYPRLFAAAVPVCGGGDVSKAASVAHIPVWIFHGSEDAAVNPLYSLDMITALTRAGSRAGLTFYPGIGHFAWLAAYSDPLMMEWLFSQHK